MSRFSGSTCARGAYTPICFLAASVATSTMICLIPCQTSFPIFGASSLILATAPLVLGVAQGRDRFRPAGAYGSGDRAP